MAPEEVDIEQRQTLWVGGLNEKVSEEILYELFQNAGPLMSVRLPVDKDTKKPKSFAFVRFHHEESVPYAIDMFRDVRLYGQNLRMQNRATGAGMPGNQNRYQQAAPNNYQQPAPNNYQQPSPNHVGFNGLQRGGPPPLQVWQGQIDPGFQQQVVPFQQGYPMAGAQQGFAERNIHQRLGYQPENTNDQQRRDHHMRHGRDENRHSHHQQQSQHNHHRSHSERGRGYDRNNHDHRHHRDRSYDNRRHR